MPAKPAWYGKLDSVIAQLEALPRPTVDSATLAFLLGVGRRRAQQILIPCIAEWIGVNGLADRQKLIGHLRRLARGEDVGYERQRRRKVAILLRDLSNAWREHPPVLVEAPAAVLQQEFAALPAGIELQPGRITLGFASPQEALEKLLVLAMAIGNDRDGFERLTSPPGSPVRRARGATLPDG
jgi:hypothetical protein